MFCLETFGQILFHSIIINVTSDGKEYARARIMVGSRTGPGRGRARSESTCALAGQDATAAHNNKTGGHEKTGKKSSEKHNKLTICAQIAKLCYIYQAAYSISLILAPLVLYAFATLLGRRLDTTTTTNTQSRYIHMYHPLLTRTSYFDCIDNRLIGYGAGILYEYIPNTAQRMQRENNF